MFALYEDNENNRAIKLVLWAAVIIAGVALDQYTKFLAANLLKPIGSYPLWKGVFHLTYVENTGAAFGILRNSRWVFMILSSVAVVAILLYLIIKCKQILAFAGVALSLIVAGGIGNMIDRLTTGYVVDFFDFTLIKFAVFNVADSCVTVGAVLLILYMLITEIQNAKKPVAKTPVADQPKQ